MDTARLPNPRDAIEQWLRGAGVPRSTASSSASLLAERNWQPAGASGALSDMRGLPDEAVLLAQRRLGRESVYREFLEGGDDPESPTKRRRHTLARASQLAAEGASTRGARRPRARRGVQRGRAANHDCCSHFY